MKVRHLDLHVHREPSIFGNFLHHLVSNSSPIEILCLTGDMYQSHWSEVHQYLLSATEGLDADAVNTIMPRLRELSFCGFDLSLPWLPALRKIVDFAKLTKLYVTKCDAASAFLHDLASIAEIKMFRLEHLAVDALNESSYHYDDEAASASASAEAIDKCMANIVRESSRGLKTLHLGWHEHYEDGQGQTNILIRNLLDEICSSHGESLRILGLHTHNYADYEEGVEALSPEDLERVCRACPKIEELGYQLGSGVLDGDTEDGDALDAFVQNIALLPSLHTLHLRFPHELEVSGFDPYRYDPDERPEYMEGLAKELRLVARKIFSKLEAYQTTKGEGGREDRRNRLEKIVIGHLTTLRQHTSKCSLPQHCFVRGGFEEGGKIVGGYSDDKEDMQEEDDSGGDDDNVNGEGDSGDHGDTSSVEPQNCEVAAKPVLRSTLRRMRLNTRVLDIDVGVEPFEQWARRAL
ncbi:hypothetical protein BU24DRAFT_82053 [Aaosphaeria arxii CBS 175.79]|uniref:Uncharacterized protein n=1 Tax=Aaosphaeria arxii CBS 175.79 TaxID=1450172 RepID=A0A6A5XA17_9PLEO|nr:uncharacterized protein BU24DRAFT_82053 [Aaosphaeria arxii CBS 175.79]KAF2009781.1 hypothetical protein BU24DRAFT_82053 [Aaosphaeria arxii CBS 175.79]